MGQTLRIEIQISSKGQQIGIVILVGHDFTDRFYDLKLVQEYLLRPSGSGPRLEPKSVFFGGDTGYCSALDVQDED